MSNRFKPATPEEMLRRGVGAPAKPTQSPKAKNDHKKEISKPSSR
jgi:hypothetical protein